MDLARPLVPAGRHQRDIGRPRPPGRIPGMLLEALDVFCKHRFGAGVGVGGHRGEPLGGVRGEILSRLPAHEHEVRIQGCGVQGGAEFGPAAGDFRLGEVDAEYVDQRSTEDVLVALLLQET